MLFPCHIMLYNKITAYLNKIWLDLKNLIFNSFQEVSSFLCLSLASFCIVSKFFILLIFLLLVLSFHLILPFFIMILITSLGTQTDEIKLFYERKFFFLFIFLHYNKPTKDENLIEILFCLMKMTNEWKERKKSYVSKKKKKKISLNLMMKMMKKWIWHL